MREIKFRAWNPKNGVMFEPFSISDRLIIDSFPKQVVIEQFTGLHDKNGREIYEGDIVNHPASATTWTVMWNEDFPSFEEHSIHNPVQHYVMTRAGAAGTEVIGNIHENPELLKSTPPLLAGEGKEKSA